jgi:hypothetical protein
LYIKTKKAVYGDGFEAPVAELPEAGVFVVHQVDQGLHHHGGPAELLAEGRVGAGVGQQAGQHVDHLEHKLELKTNK